MPRIIANVPRQPKFDGTEHILLGLLDEEEGLAARVLTELGVTKADPEAWIIQELRKGA